MCSIAFDRQRANEHQTRIEVIQETLQHLHASLESFRKQKSKMLRKVQHFDQEIAAIQETCDEGKKAMEERGVDLVAAKQTLVNWKAKFENVSKSLNKKVFQLFNG
jgi:uncharacterized coiled-coil DUF342 family protein